jgi:hypothetical protein
LPLLPDNELEVVGKGSREKRKWMAEINQDNN